MKLDIKGRPDAANSISNLHPEACLPLGSVLAQPVLIADDAAGKTSAAESGKPAKTKRRSIRILLVDDHRMVRTGLASLLSQRPYLEVVAEAENGLEALELAKQKRPDLILMDVVMPEMGGVEATKAIKAILPEIQIVGLSMFDEREIRQRMVEAGACQYLSKSASSEELLQAIDDCMSQRV